LDIEKSDYPEFKIKADIWELMYPNLLKMQ
jgi:hypothetical protein